MALLLLVLEQAFDMRISMQAQCKTRLHDALVTHIYRQTKGIQKGEKPLKFGLLPLARRPPGPIVVQQMMHSVHDTVAVVL